MNTATMTLLEAKSIEAGYGASQVLFDAYQARVRPADALAFWEIRPK